MWVKFGEDWTNSFQELDRKHKKLRHKQHVFDFLGSMPQSVERL